MSIKDLFNNYKSNQFSPSQSELSASKLAESTEHIQNKFVEKFRYEPPIDFTTASNFAKFGSAELYYEYAFKRIYQQYPYDGTLAEQQEFHNNSTFLDKYIFDNVYPRTTGHVIFSSEGATTSSAVDNYGNPTEVQYISVFGGPHTASGGMEGKELTNTFDNSMIYDESKDRVGSFEWNPTSGSTIEFWLKKSNWAYPSQNEREVVLDIWNQEITSSNSYGRITLELYNNHPDSPINLTMYSGSNSFEHLGLCPSTFTTASLVDGEWHHYAISITSDESSGTSIDFYQDGRYLHTTSSTVYIGDIKNVSGGVNAYIGALQTATYGQANGAGWGKLSASLDEFRYWKKKRTTNEIGEYWFINMGGGTNKREYNTDLGVYFKFNEGITGDSTIDQNILDYSGRISNGIMVGYKASARSTESAFESLTNVEEYKDPIIYSSHPTVSSSLATYKTTGSIQDYENTSLLYNLFPSWIVEEDYENGQNLRYLTQIMASYFDTLNAQISGITEFKSKRYFSGSAKPNTYAREVLRGQGFVIPDIFVEADILEEIRGKDDNETYDGDIQKVKNLIYQNIYNNLNYIYKSKGTEKSFRNLFRCFGVDSELLKLNLYSDDSTYLYKDNYEFTSIAKPVLNLNKESQLSSTVFLSSSSGLTYLSSSEGDDEQYTSMTFECEAIFPYKFEKYETGYFPTPFTTASIAGFHRALTSSAADLTWHSDDTDLRIYALKQDVDSRHAKFLLTGSGVELTSSLYRDVYYNNKWILAARVKHSKYPFAGFNVTGATGGDYTVEFYGVNSVANDVKNEFLLTQSVSNTIGKNLLGHAKRIYAGSHRQDFTGSSLQDSDVKVSQVRYWQSHLSDDEIKEHSYDPTNYGLIHPYRSDAVFQVSGSETVYVPQIETLALHWDFMEVTSSDSSGEFIVSDISSGSTSWSNKYSMIGKITKNKYDGYGYGFDNSSVDVVDKEFIYTAKKRLPDEVYSSDGVKIKTEETENFFEDDKVADHFYMFEKSPYNAVSQQMINFFGSMKDFNSLIGDPAERYRFQYKQMEDIKRLFFERVENVPDPERFFEYFKWIDTSISYAISQLIPASSRFAEDIKDVVESHILERNKYQEKFPLTAQQRSTEGVVKSFSEMFYNWRTGHAPLDGSDNKNCLWQKVRRKVEDTNVQALRDNIYKTSNTKLDKVYDIVTEQVYEGNTDAVRRLSRPYRINMELKQNIHGGTNYYAEKNRDFLLEVVHPHGPTTAVGIPKNVLVAGVGVGQGLVPETVCEDEETENYKEKYKFDGVDGRYSSNQNNYPLSDFVSYKNYTKGIATFPMNIMSQSNAVNTGYQSTVTSKFKSSAYITNLHSDTVDRTNEVPMQGPFTERHIGGHQSRHISINKYDSSLIDGETGTAPTNNIHNLYTRPEAWRLLFGEHPSEAVVDGALGFTPPDYGISSGTGIYPDVAKKRASFYREEKAKRPVNIKNIKHSESGSVVGNYKNNYEFMMLQGRRENNLYFRDNPEITNYLPVQYTSSLPHTTHVMSLVGIDPTDAGNVWGTHANSMQPDQQLISAEIPGSTASGSFKVTGSTVDGTFASGSFSLNRQIEPATPAKFSFDVSGSHYAGSNASGSFSFTRSTTAAVSASIAFTVKGRTIEEVNSSGSFTVTGSKVNDAYATASFDVAGLPVGGERSYAIFDVGFENVKDSHTISLGRNSSTWAAEIELLNGYTAGNQPVSPFYFQKAVEIVGATDHYSGAVDANSSTAATLSFYVYIHENAITGNGLDKYIYQSKGNYSSVSIPRPSPVIEVFFTGSSAYAGDTRKLIARQYFENSSGDLGYYERIYHDVWSSGWHNIVILSNVTAVGELQIAIDAVNSTNSLTTVNGSTPHSLAVPIRHTVMGDGVKTDWYSNPKISDFIYWNFRASTATDIFRTGIRPPDASLYSSNLRAHYSFGDYTGDNPKYITDESTVSNISLTSSWDGTKDDFVDSNFIYRKTPTQFFNDVKTALQSNSNSTYFNFYYNTYTSASSETFQPIWPATSSTDIVVAPGTITPNPTYPVNSGYDLNFATFYVVSKAETNNSNYQIAPTINTGSYTNELSMSFKNLTFDGTGSLQANATTNSIEDSSITIDGTTITFDHHANSQGGNQVKTYTTSYYPCLSGSSNGSSAINLNNSSYPSDSTLNGGNDLSISLWASRVLANTNTETLIVLDSALGNNTNGAVTVNSTNAYIILRIYQNSTIYKQFYVSWASLSDINREDLNHYIFTFDVSTMSATIYINGINRTVLTAGTATSFSHTYSEIRLANTVGGGIYEMQGRLCQVSIWDKILTSTEAHELYHDGRIKDLYGHSAVSNLVHWYKLGTEAGWPSVGSDLSTFTTIPDSTPRYIKADLTVNNPTYFTSSNGLPDNTISDATFWTNLDSTIDSAVTDYNATHTSGDFTVTNTTIGTIGNGDSLSENSDLISNLETTTGGGVDAGGAVDGDTITIDGIVFELDANADGVSGTNKDINCDPTVSNTTFWNSLSQSIKDFTDFDNITINDNGNGTATFSITASTGGTNNDGVVSISGTSFSNLVQTAGGVDQSGSVDGHYIALIPETSDLSKFNIDSDGSGTDGVPANNYYVDSSTATNTEFWNNLSTSIGDRGFGVSYVAGVGQATFTVVSYYEGADGNTISSETSYKSGNTFEFASQGLSPCAGDSYFCGGSDIVDNNDGDTFTLDSKTFELDSDGAYTATYNIASSGSLTDTEVFNNITASIIAQTDFDTVTYSVVGSTATFSVTSSVTGTVKNGSFTAGTGFTLVSQTAGGTNTSGSQYGDILTIGNHGVDVDITVGNGVSPDASLSSTAWWNDLSQSIKDNTNYDTITIIDNGTYATFQLTSSIAELAGNDTHTETGTTFFNLTDSTGGSDDGDSSDGSRIFISGISFVLDSDGTYSGDFNIPSSASLSDNEVFNALTQSIKDNTSFDTITMSPSTGNNRTLSLTSSVTGSDKNGDITSPSGDFAIVSQTAGGTDESGAVDGDSILIHGVRFVLDNDSSGVDGVPANTYYIDCSDGVANTDFWNALSQSIKDNTVFDTISYVVNSSQEARFNIESSTTGSALNIALQETGSSFFDLYGISGGSDSVPAVYSQNDVVLAVPTPTLRNGDQNKTIISSRFSAPGSIDTLSNAYLDIYARELSVHNALPFRNLTVRTDSGEVNHIRVNDHLGQRRGLNTLLALHSGQFGIDSEYGSIVESTYSTSGSFNKQHRNRSKRMEYSGSSIITGSLFDNAFVSTPIPRSEFQYAWIRNSLSASGYDWEADQRILGYQAEDGFVSSSAGYVEAIVFPSSSNIT